MRNEPKAIIFADIDGAITDGNHNSQHTEPIIKQLLYHGALIVLCSSKTQPEIEILQKKLDINDPFIAENGGAIYIPKDYFPFKIRDSTSTGKFDIIELGMPYSVVRKKLAHASTKTQIPTVGFGDMSIDKIAEDTNLTLPLAALAKKRMYDEPFKTNQKNTEHLQEAVKAEGLTLMIGDKYFHVVGNTDKGKATTRLRQLFERKFGTIITYGVGSSQNDYPMLAAVDIPMLVRRKMGGWNASLPVWKNIFRLHVGLG